MGRNYGRTPGVEVPYTLERGKEFYRARKKWMTLALANLSKVDLKYALSRAITLTTRSKAEEWAIKNAESGWSFKILDHLGFCGDLCYRGVAIRHFYRRQTLEHQINELTPATESGSIDPEDAWVYIDLTGLSAKEAHRPTIEMIKDLKTKLTQSERRIESQNDVNIQQEKEINKLLEKISKMEESAKRIRSRYLAAQAMTLKDNKSRAKAMSNVMAKTGVRHATNKSGSGKKKSRAPVGKARNNKGNAVRRRKAVTRSGHVRR